MIELYHGGAASPHSASVLVLLAEKGADYAGHAIDLAGIAQHGADFLALNPAGQVPLLVHDGRRLTETFFLLAYLDELLPDPPLGGATARARYAAQIWGKYVEGDLAPNLALARWAVQGGVPPERLDAVRAGVARLPDDRRALWTRALDGGFGASEQAAGATAIAGVLDRIEGALAEGPWLAGDAYGLADIAVFPHVRALAGGRSPLPGVAAGPRAEAWLARIEQRPAVAGVLAGADGALVTMGPERGRWG